jgi:hypothetical protein
MSPVPFIFLFGRSIFLLAIEELCYCFPGLGVARTRSLITRLSLFDSLFLSQPRHLLSYVRNVDPAIMRPESQGLRYSVAFSEDFGKQSYTDSYR